jgi:hypothetical protein
MNSRPMMPQVAGFPWAARPDEFRRQTEPPTPSYIDPMLRGVVAGTNAYDAGGPPPVLHAHEPQIQPIHMATPAPQPPLPHDLPAPYNWDGTGDIPGELWAMAADLASAGVPGIPSQNDPAAFAGWLGQLYDVIVAPGEGCGANPQTVALAIIQNAPAGPHAVAFALQQVARQSSVCAPLFTNPLEPPGLTGTPTRDVGNEIPTPTGTLQIPTQTKAPKPKSPLPWVIGGMGLVTVVGIAWYLMYRSNRPKKRRNPCGKCSNPLVVEWEDERENPYGGDRGFTSIDGGVMSEAAVVSPLVGSPRLNPRRRRKSTRSKR